MTSPATILAGDVQVPVDSNWGGQRCFVVGGGPSLRPWVGNLRTLHEKGRVIAANDAFRYCSPDLIFSIDHTWLEKRMNEIPMMNAPVIVAVSKDHKRPEIPNLHYMTRIDRGSEPKMTLNPLEITNGLNSGFGAVNLAFLKGATQIILLGFDFRAGSDDNDHFHSGYSWYNKRSSRRIYPQYAQLLDHCSVQLKNSGVDVVNCSNSGVLKKFRYMPYEAWL